MQKKHLFLDHDGLQFFTVPSLVVFMNDFFEIPSVITDYTNKHSKIDEIVKSYKPGFDMSRGEIFFHISDKFHTSIKYHEDVVPVRGFCDVAPKLAEKFILHTVTARSTYGMGVMSYLLDKYAPNCISHIHCANRYIGNHKFSEISKREYMLRFQGNIAGFIDDSPEEIHKVKDVIESFLFDPEYEHTGEDVDYRVESWREIGEIFL